eukprot:3633332-Alexandrium_andersonii.AAC.1
MNGLIFHPTWPAPALAYGPQANESMIKQSICNGRPCAFMRGLALSMHSSRRRPQLASAATVNPACGPQRHKSMNR